MISLVYLFSSILQVFSELLYKDLLVFGVVLLVLKRLNCWFQDALVAEVIESLLVNVGRHS